VPPVDSIKCLEGKTAQELFDAIDSIGSVGFGVTVDGVELTATPMELLQSNSFAGTPAATVKGVMVGSNAEDSAVDIGANASYDDFRRFVQNTDGFGAYLQNHSALWSSLLPLYENR
jgi:hypothetical protein